MEDVQVEPLVEPASVVLELVGPAGAGKTTLSRALQERTSGVTLGIQPSRIALILGGVSISTTFLTDFFVSCYRGHWVNATELRSLVFLKVWHRTLKRYPPANDSVTVLDHGPIFRLAMLREFGPDFTKSKTFTRWWHSMIEKWAATLQLVIWLDAPDSVLFHRVNARSQKHRVKGQSEGEVRTFLARYRASFEHTVEQMTNAGGPQVLRVDTQLPLDEVVDRVLNALNRPTR